MSPQSRPREDERGQSIIIIALAMLGMIAFLALVMDGGMLYLQRRRMQNAADAAAFAGSRQMVLSGTTNGVVLTMIQDYAEMNQAIRNQVQAYYVSADPDTGQPVRMNSIASYGSGNPPPAGAVGVEVIASTTFESFFLGAVMSASAVAWESLVPGPPPSLIPLQVSATSIGVYGPPSANTGGFLPLAISETEAQTAFQDLQGGGSGEANLFRTCCHGNFGWVDFNGGANSQQELLDWITNGYNGTVNVGNEVPGDPGMRGRQEENAMNARTGQVAIVLVYDWSAGHGQNLRYHIIGFAAFQIGTANLTGKGNQQTIIGYFRYFVARGGRGVDFNGRDFGMRAIQLLR